jgi:hypothetical protein
MLNLQSDCLYWLFSRPCQLGLYKTITMSCHSFIKIYVARIYRSYTVPRSLHVASRLLIASRMRCVIRT